jgi:hypothetical protein
VSARALRPVPARGIAQLASPCCCSLTMARAMATGLVTTPSSWRPLSPIAASGCCACTRRGLRLRPHHIRAEEEDRHGAQAPRAARRHDRRWRQRHAGSPGLGSRSCSDWITRANASYQPNDSETGLRLGCARQAAGSQDRGK